MSCERCDECREAGYLFCVHCGEPLDACPHCEESMAEGHAFCISCGRPLRPVPEKPVQSSWNVIRNIVIGVSALVTLLMITELCAMLLGIGDVWGWASHSYYDVLLLIPKLTSVGLLGGTGLQMFWIVIVVAITASVALLLYQSLPALRAPRDEVAERFSETPLYWVALLLGAALFLNIICALMQIDDMTLPDDTGIGFVPEALYAYANAAVWEEVITRMVWIGIPMTVLGLLCRKKDALKYLVGGFGMSRAALILIVVSSVVFGFGHLSGWGLWKVLPTFISGLAMGYLYVRFGVHASIAFHFIVDYMAVLVDGPLAILASVILMVVIVSGIPAIIEIARRLMHSPEAIREMPNIVPPDQESIFSRRD